MKKCFLFGLTLFFAQGTELLGAQKNNSFACLAGGLAVKNNNAQAVPILQNNKKKPTWYGVPSRNRLNYAARVDERRDENAKVEEDRIYHNYPKQMDGYIEKFGEEEHNYNKTFKNNLDTQYNAKGVVCYPSGQKEALKFHITVNNVSKEVYHRGVNRVAIDDNNQRQMIADFERAHKDLLRSNQIDQELLSNGRVLLYDKKNAPQLICLDGETDMIYGLCKTSQS